MCYQVEYNGVVAETLGELLDVMNIGDDGLVMASGYEHLVPKESACLCPIDIRKTLEPLGYKVEDDDVWGYVVRDG